MKRQAIVLITALTVLGALIYYSFAAKPKIQTKGDLPELSQKFIATHFPEEKTAYMLVDIDGFRRTYELMLTSGKELEFNKKGEWKEIDAKIEAVPEAIIPPKIVQFVNENFGESAFVVQIEKKHWGFEVELSNKLELEFSSKARFIGYDD